MVHFVDEINHQVSQFLVIGAWFTRSVLFACVLFFSFFKRTLDLLQDLLFGLVILLSLDFGGAF